MKHRVIDDQQKIVSIIGMSKNSGKTVTLGYLIEEAFESGRVLGLTSIGRDGETTDIVTQTDKPRVYVYRGTFVATAEMLFNLSEAKLEIVETTKFYTPMGRVIIAKALEDGYVQIGGANANKDIRRLADRMLELGADLIYVDGALDRSSPASPIISDSCVLATGAAVDRYMHKTIEKTAHLAELFGIARVEEALPISEDSPEPEIVDDEGRVRVLDEIKTALGAGRKIAEAVDQHTKYVVIKGALVAKTIRDYIESTDYHKGITWVVRDATRIFIDALDWKYFVRAGVEIAVIHPVKLLVITANPTSPYSHSYDSSAFLDGLRERIPNIPVINVLEVDQ